MDNLFNYSEVSVYVARCYLQHVGASEIGLREDSFV